MPYSIIPINTLINKLNTMMMNDDTARLQAAIVDKLQVDENDVQVDLVKDTGKVLCKVTVKGMQGDEIKAALT
jgi:hypothetical protein